MLIYTFFFKRLAQTAKGVLVSETEKPKGMMVTSGRFWYSSAHSLRSPDFFFLFLFPWCQLYPEDLPLRWLSVGHRAICTPVPSSPRKNSAIPFFWIGSGRVPRTEITVVKRNKLYLLAQSRSWVSPPEPNGTPIGNQGLSGPICSFWLVGQQSCW